MTSNGEMEIENCIKESLNYESNIQDVIRVLYSMCKNERCLQQSKALTQMVRVSDFHSEGSRFDSCM